jgi:hypothetical protein
LLLLRSAFWTEADLDSAGKSRKETIKREVIFFRVKRAGMRSVGGMRRGRDGLLVTVGAALAIIVLLVLQSVIDIGPLSTRTVTLTVTTSDAHAVQVANAYAAHLAHLSARTNATAIRGDYESNATLEWNGNGQTYGVQGTYSGGGNIVILWGSTISRSKNASVSIENESIGVSKGDVYVVNSTLDLQGWEYCGTSSPIFVGDVNGSVLVVGHLSGTVIAQDFYAHVSNNSSSSWLITRETWNFTQLDEPPLPDCFPFPGLN